MTWDIWMDFCLNLCISLWLKDINDPIILLQVFGERYRTGRIAPGGKPV